MMRIVPCLMVILPLLFSCEKQTDHPQQKEIDESSRQAKPSRISQSRLSAEAELRSLKDSPPADLAARRLAEAWKMVNLDPVGAWSHVEVMDERLDDRQRLLEHCVLTMAAMDFYAAKKWAEAMPSSADREAATARIAVLMAAVSPDEAMRFLEQQGSSGYSLEVAAVEILQLWAQTSGIEAARRALIIPPSPLRESGLRGVTEQWLQTDAASYGNWLSTLPSHDSQQAMINAAALVLSQKTADQRQRLLDEWPHELQKKISARLQISAP